MMLKRLAVFALFLIACGLLGRAFWMYRENAWLCSVFQRGFSTFQPLYARSRPLDFADAAILQRLYIASAIISGSLIMLMVLAHRRCSPWLAVPLAATAAIAINASVAHIPAGNASFVSPYARTTLEYFGDVSAVGDSPLMFIRTYPAISPTLSHHAGTHPPGGVMFLWAVSRLIGESIDVAAWASTVFGALAIIPTHWLARQWIGSRRAGRLLPIYVVTPSLVLFGATSMDIVFFTFAAISLATMTWAMRRLSVTRVLIAGVCFWLATFMTFAVIALPVLCLSYVAVTAIRRPRRAGRMFVRLALVGVAFIATQAIAEMALGYDLLMTADAAMYRDLRGVRYLGYESIDLWQRISIANGSAFLFGTGIALSAACVVGFFVLPMTRPVLVSSASRLAVALPICVLVLSTCTLFTFETERVWLCIVPAMLCVAASLRGMILWIALVILLAVQSVLTECYAYTHW